MTKRLTFIFALAALIASGASAQKKEVTHTGIVDHIIMADSMHIIIQDEEVARLLEYVEPQKERKKDERIGYRVQVFSDNNARTARNEARSKQRAVGTRFAQYRTYVTYSTPYWRVKVGDFRTQEEANSAATAIRRAFPGFANEVRVVRDRINIPKTSTKD